jgi:hypothetical protein
MRRGRAGWGDSLTSATGRTTCARTTAGPLRPSPPLTSARTTAGSLLVGVLGTVGTVAGGRPGAGWDDSLTRAMESSQRHCWSVFWVLLVNSTRNRDQQFTWYCLTRVLLFGPKQVTANLGQTAVPGPSCPSSTLVERHPGQQHRDPEPWPTVYPDSRSSRQQYPGQASP